MVLEGMHIAAIPNRGRRPTYLLRKSVRDGRHVRTETLTKLSDAQIGAMRRVLKGEKLGPLDGGLECVGSKLHGHVDAVRTAMARLGFDKLIDAKFSRSRDLVMAMIAVRIITPEASKLSMAGAFADTTLADDLGLQGVDVMPEACAARRRALRGVMIGVGIGSRRPLPPNRAGGFSAHGFPVRRVSSSRPSRCLPGWVECEQPGIREEGIWPDRKSVV